MAVGDEDKERERAQRAELDRRRRRAGILSVAKKADLSDEELLALRDCQGALARRPPDKILERLLEKGLVRHALGGLTVTDDGKMALAGNDSRLRGPRI